jgi:hypothetical protein
MPIKWLGSAHKILGGPYLKIIAHKMARGLGPYYLKHKIIGPAKVASYIEPYTDPPAPV